MNHTRTIHCTNKKLSLSKASYPVRRAGQHMAAVHGVATKLRRQNPTKFSPITAILQHSEQFEKMTSSRFQLIKIKNLKIFLQKFKHFKNLNCKLSFV